LFSQRRENGYYFLKYKYVTILTWRIVSVVRAMLHCAELYETFQEILTFQRVASPLLYRQHRGLELSREAGLESALA
jgi:hypothetical protein